MGRTVLLAWLLGELAVPSHALLHARAPETYQDLSLTEGTHESTFDAFRHGGMLGNALVDLDELTDAAGPMLDQLTSHMSMFEADADDDGRVDNESEGRKLRPWMKRRELRAQLHAEKYVTEFVVELNMTRAHETGQSIGMIAQSNEDFMPASVCRIKKTGLLEEWNNANPGKEVHLGDEIVQVNNIKWHANTNAFIGRISGQFTAARNLMEGTDRTLRLYIQRPRVSQYTDFLSQRDRNELDDAHTQAYAAEFVAELPMPDDIQNTTLDNIMGWNIGARHEWNLATIRMIRRKGSVATWNEMNPDNLILEGDELMKIDNIINFFSSHNSSVFLNRLARHYKNAQSANATRRSMLVRIQRPRAVQEAFDLVHPIEEKVVSTSTVTAWIPLRFGARGGADLFPPGSDVDPRPRRVLVADVLHPSRWERWNEGNPDRAIVFNDEVLGVTRYSSDHSSSHLKSISTRNEFALEVQMALVSATLLNVSIGGSEEANGRLLLARRTKTVKKVRHNMENGVHMACVGCTTTTAEWSPP